MEDAIYNSSSQHKLWSFTPEALDSVRKASNTAAAAQVREAISRAREKKQLGGGKVANGMESDVSASAGVDTPNLDGGGGSGGGTNGVASAEEKEIECLTVEEEVKLVRYYCRKIMDIAAVFEFPTNVKATAPTFLRRFFTRTSPMTYHPKTLLSTILYLTTKTENHYIHLNEFSSKIPKSTPEEILAPEFVVAMGLRWCFELKHPFRGLEGGIMELIKTSEGNYTAPPNPHEDGDGNFVPPTAAQWQARLHNLPPLPHSTNALPPKPRIERAHGKARAILSGPALLTDAYFLFTPPQIYIAGIYLVDPALALFYLDLKHPFPHQAPLKEKLIAIIERCAEEIRQGGEPGQQISKEEMDEVIRIDRKLYFCRNPEKIDLLGASKREKRGVTEEEENVSTSGNGNGNENGSGNGNGTAAGGGSGGVSEGGERREREIKKRKLEREKSLREGEDLFGSQHVIVERK